METQSKIYEGATVYASDGEKLGTVRDGGDSYILVEKGFFFPKDYYIPVSFITSSSQDEVRLSVTKDEALNQGWDTEQRMTSGDTASAAAWSTDATASNVSATQDLSRVPQQPATGMTAQTDATRVPVHEERLEAQKREAQAGEVKISKRVVTERQTIEVPVTEERVRVDWRAPSGETTAEGEVFQEGTIEVPVSREVVDVSKRTVQTGELEVSKERQQRTERVSDEVRREVLDVDDGGLDVEQGSGA